MKLVERFITRNPCYSANMSNADAGYTTFHRRGPLGRRMTPSQQSVAWSTYTACTT